MDPKDIFGQENKETVSFEELENVFKTPTQKQSDYENPYISEPSNLPNNLVNPNNENLLLEETETPADVSPEKAQRTGERIAKLIDTGIDFALSNFVAHNNESYRADEKDLKDISECWGEISQEHGWSLGPEWSLIILYFIVYGPIVKQAFTDRRLAEIEERQKQQETRIDDLEERLREKTEINGTTEPTQSQNDSPFVSQPVQG